MGVSVRSPFSLTGVEDYCRALRETADLLDQAQTVEEFRRAVGAQRHLWQVLCNRLGGIDLPVPPDSRASLRAEGAFIMEACDQPGSPSDMQVEAFIAINRRVARHLARLGGRAATRGPVRRPMRASGAVTDVARQASAGYPV